MHHETSNTAKTRLNEVYRGRAVLHRVAIDRGPLRARSHNQPQKVMAAVELPCYVMLSGVQFTG